MYEKSQYLSYRQIRYNFGFLYIYLLYPKRNLNLPSKRNWLNLPHSGVCDSKYFSAARQAAEQFRKGQFSTSLVKPELYSCSPSCFSCAISSPGFSLFCFKLFPLLVLSNSFRLPDTVSSFFRFCEKKLINRCILMKVISVSVLSLALSFDCD